MIIYCRIWLFKEISYVCPIIVSNNKNIVTIVEISIQDILIIGK